MRTAIAAIAAAAVAASAVPVSASSGDPYRSRQWGLDRIRAADAWNVARGSGAVIAVVDSGVDLTHPDLAPKLIVHPDADFVEPAGECQSQQGTRTCIQDGPQDEHGHGTHVAGIAAAATNNGIGVAGVAPDAKILPVRVLDDDNSGSISQIARGIRYATRHGVDVINLSFGAGIDGPVRRGTGSFRPIYEAIDQAWGAGITIVASAGNQGIPLCNEPSSHPRVVCVGATDRSDMKAHYSNADAAMTSKYLVAPGGEGSIATCGGEIFSTYLRTQEPVCSSERGYEADFGTSMAAPFVSGIAAVVAALPTAPANQQIVDCILRSASDLGAPGRDSVYGYGLANAFAAVTACS